MAHLATLFVAKRIYMLGLEDSAYMQLGVARPLSPKWNIGAFYDYREPASVFSTEVHELVPYISWQISDKLELHRASCIRLHRGKCGYGGVGSNKLQLVTTRQIFGISAPKD